jgi:hypothetical protein
MPYGDAELSAWLAKIGRELSEKLAVVGLIPRREKAEPEAQIAAGLGAFLDC